MGDQGPFGFSGREWSIVLPLSFAAFFENYDYALVSIAAPVISRGLGVSASDFGVVVSVIRLAGLSAIALVALADRVGRRRMLLITLGGLALTTGLTAAAWGLVSFLVLGSLSRVFLSAEGVMTGVVIAEEVHPARRGRAIAVSGLIGQTGFGAVAVLIVVVPHLPLGWRWLFLAALVPLAVVATLRRNLTETEAFDRAAAEDRVGRGRPRLGRRWWPRTSACVVVFGLVGAFQTAAVYHAAQLAQTTYDWTGRYTVIVLTSGIFTFAGFVVGGRGSDHVGRRPVISAGVVIETTGMAVLFLAGPSAYVWGWYLFVLGQAMIAGCWVAFVAELVPTEVRAFVTSLVVSTQVAGGSLGLAVTSAWGSTPRAAGRATVWIGAATVAALSVLWRLPEVAGRDVVSAYADRDGPGPADGPAEDAPG